MMAGLCIRGIAPSDVPAVYTLLRAKAAFDGCPEALLATEDSLRAALFGPAPMTRALVATVDGRPAGFATYHAIFSTFLMRPGLWLDDLYIETPQRGKGIGRALMAHLCAIAKEHGCARVDWIVAVSNDSGQRFYTRLGAGIKEGVRLCRLDGAAIDRLAREHTTSLIEAPTEAHAAAW